MNNLINGEPFRLKYVERSFENKPSFLIEIEGVEYISNGCEFVENTAKNRNRLLKSYDCGDHLSALLDSEWTDMSSVKNAGSMFEGCTTLQSFEADMSSVTDACWMFYSCTTLQTFEADMSTVEYAYGMFRGCTNLKRGNLRPSAKS